MREATEAPLVGEGAVRTDSGETDELPPQKEEFTLESCCMSEESDPPPLKISEWEGIDPTETEDRPR